VYGFLVESPLEAKFEGCVIEFGVCLRVGSLVLDVYHVLPCVCGRLKYCLPQSLLFAFAYGGFYLLGWVFVCFYRESCLGLKFEGCLVVFGCCGVLGFLFWVLFLVYFFWELEFI